MKKRGQLGMIEFQYFMTGLVIGIIVAAVVIYLSINGVIPISLKSMFCGIVTKGK
jgi:hypothetical protein